MRSIKESFSFDLSIKMFSRRYSWLLHKLRVDIKGRQDVSQLFEADVYPLAVA